MPRIIILDTETNRLVNPEPIQVAWLPVRFSGSYIVVDGDPYCENFEPEQPITAAAAAVHHILPSDVVGCRASLLAAIPDDCEYIIGHNVDFDWDVMRRPNVKRICTLAMSRAIFPKKESHSQSSLMYSLFGMTCEVRDIVAGAHSAASDVVMCRMIADRLSKIESIDSVESMWEFSERARIPKVMPFGKHKGLPIEDVPQDYCDWLIRQGDVDPYLVKAILER